MVTLRSSGRNRSVSTPRCHRAVCWMPFSLSSATIAVEVQRFSWAWLWAALSSSHSTGSSMPRP